MAGVKFFEVVASRWNTELQKGRYHLEVLLLNTEVNAMQKRNSEERKRSSIRWSIQCREIWAPLASASAKGFRPRAHAAAYLAY